MKRTVLHHWSHIDALKNVISDQGTQKPSAASLGTVWMLWALVVRLYKACWQNVSPPHDLA
eukprot:1145895-Pelagomonas_calceolata.AAC.3